MAGITFRDRFFVVPNGNTESIYAHELVHTIQWRVLGVDAFLLTYGLGLIEHNYEGSPLEQIAFAVQQLFDQGAAIPDAGAKIAEHARSTGDRAGEIFRTHGIPFGA